LVYSFYFVLYKMAEPANLSDELETLSRNRHMPGKTPSGVGSSIASNLRDVESKFGGSSSDTQSQDVDAEILRERAGSPRAKSLGPAWDKFYSKERKPTYSPTMVARRAPGPTINKILRNLVVDGIDITIVLEKFRDALAKAEETDGSVDPEVGLIRSLIEYYNTKPSTKDELLFYIYEMIIEAKNALLIDSTRNDNILEKIVVANKDKLYQKRDLPSSATLESITRNADIIRLKQQTEYLRRVEEGRRRALAASITRRTATEKDKVMAELKASKMMIPPIPAVVKEYTAPVSGISQGSKTGKAITREMLYSLIQEITEQQLNEATRRSTSIEEWRAQGQRAPYIPGGVWDRGRSEMDGNRLKSKECDKCDQPGLHTYDGKKPVCRCINHLTELSV
jgi:hypothetical protein